MFMKKFNNWSNSYNSIHSSHYLQIMGSLPLTQVCSLRTTTRKIVLLNSQSPCYFWTYNFAICFLWNENLSIFLFTISSTAAVLLQTVDLSVNPSAYKLSYANTRRHTNTNQQTYIHKSMSFKNRKESSHAHRQKQRCTEKNPHIDALTRKKWDSPSMDIPGKLSAWINHPDMTHRLYSLTFRLVASLRISRQAKDNIPPAQQIEAEYAHEGQQFKRKTIKRSLKRLN